MELPFGGTFASDTFETGTRAAAWGGTTTIIDFAVQRTGEVVQDGLAAWHAQGRRQLRHRLRLPQIIGGVDDESLKAMDYLVDDEGITSFKLFMAYPGVFYSDDGQILRAMQTAARQRRDDHDARRERHRHRRARRSRRWRAARPTRSTTASPGRRSSRPRPRTGRSCWPASPATCPLYIVHMSAGEALEEVAAARDDGRNVFAETCPQYLYLTLEEHARRSPASRAPSGSARTPLRTRRTRHHQADLWKGLRTNDLAVVSHRPLPVLHEGPEGARHRRLLQDPQRHRRRRAPHGPASTRVSSTARSSLARWVETCATTPARMFGLYPKKGVIAPGLRRRHRRLRPERPRPTIGVDDAPHEHGPLGLGGLR